MNYQVLARKWRPKRFADLVGQEHVVRALSNALHEHKLHHAYLLTGTRGVGKTTIARILAKSLNCETGTTAEPCGECSACTQIDAGRFVDLLEIDAASNTGIDNIREVLENAQYAPTAGRFKVYIIDEVHMLSKSAFNAMLKTLEEPPAHVKFILATTDPQKVPVTVLSRCLQFALRNMTPQQVASHLAHVLNVENITHETAALSLLGRAAAGSMRDGLSLLDQAIAYGMGAVKESDVRAMLGAVDSHYLYALLQALSDGDGRQLMAEAAELTERGIGFDSVLSELAMLLQQIALAQTVPQAIADDEPERDTLFTLAAKIAPEEVQLYYQIAIHGRKDLALAPDEQAGFTMTLLRMLAFHPVHSGEATRHDKSSTRPASQPTPQASHTQPKLASPAAKALQAAGLPTKTIPAPLTPTAEFADISTPIAEPAPIVSKPVPAIAAAPTPAAATEPEEDADEELEQVTVWPEPLEQEEAAKTSYDFDGDWPGLLTLLGAKLGAARMLAQNSVLKSWTQQRLELAVPESFRHMSGRDYQDKLRQALSDQFGRPIELAVVIEELGQETPAMQDARQRQQQVQLARECLQNDPVVQQMLREFDATLLMETIQPIKE
ncbi:DNA polymerase III subunit gamma/tau [Neisseriaceae bacterium TC5R-5]|nr:DNA polymerase III subunit gamma/tau [Neisseriaceae bacterium TC5R-5]